MTSSIMYRRPRKRNTRTLSKKRPGSGLGAKNALPPGSHVLHRLVWKHKNRRV